MDLGRLKSLTRVGQAKNLCKDQVLDGLLGKSGGETSGTNSPYCMIRSS